MTYCPRCHSPINADAAHEQSCEVCSWFGDRCGGMGPRSLTDTPSHHHRMNEQLAQLETLVTRQLRLVNNLKASLEWAYKRYNAEETAEHSQRVQALCEELQEEMDYGRFLCQHCRAVIRSLRQAP